MFSKVNTGDVAFGGISIEGLRTEKGKVENKLQAKRKQLDNVEDELRTAGKTLDDLREKHGLPKDASANAVGRFFDQLVGLKERLERHEVERRRFENKIKEFSGELKDITITLSDAEVIGSPIDDPVDNINDVFAAIERAVNHLKYAKEVQKADQAFSEVKKDVLDILNQWDTTPSRDLKDSEFIDALDEFVERGNKFKNISTSGKKETSHARNC